MFGCCFNSRCDRRRRKLFVIFIIVITNFSLGLFVISSIITNNEQEVFSSEPNGIQSIE
jgi:hypothetical protein